MENQNEYDSRVAQHYAAYRPPIHDMILLKCLPDQPLYPLGLDIGSGTGYSAIALKNFCYEVTGIEPAEEMLLRAVSFPGVKYLQGGAEEIPVPDQCADIITFAGSLFYADVPRVANEVRRIVKSEGIVVCYDFAIDIAALLHKTGFTIPNPEGAYDHSVNFSRESDFIALEIKEETMTFVLDDVQAMHILLSHRSVFQECNHCFPGEEAEKIVLQLLQKQSHEVGVRLFYSVFRIRR